MGSGTDSLTWLALGAALTVAGLLVAVLVWSRRGPGRGLRVAGWALLPLAAALTGLLRLAADIVDAVGRWATRLVFSPTVWLGVVVAGVAVLLWVVGGLLSARSGRRTAPAVTGRPGPPAAPPARQGRGKEQLMEDQDDIEAILRKHGIQ
jgi:hypothetical protein